MFHLGPNGAGCTVKLLLNLMWFIEAVAVGEVLTVGVRAGVSLDRLHAALVGSPADSVFLERDVRMVLDDGDYDDAFRMRLVTKDLGLAVDLARETGVPAELPRLSSRSTAGCGTCMATTRVRSALCGCTKMSPGCHCGFPKAESSLPPAPVPE